MVTIGILLSYMSDTFWADENKLDCWRWMFWAGVVPALVLLVGMCFVPETPRWLLSKGRLKECRKVLQKIEPENTVNDLIGQMEVEIEKDRNSAVGMAIFDAALVENSSNDCCLYLCFFQTVL